MHNSDMAQSKPRVGTKIGLCLRRTEERIAASVSRKWVRWAVMAVALSSIGNAKPSLAERIGAIETVMDQFYRGESLEMAQKRLVRQVRDFNALVTTREAGLKAPNAKAEQALTAARNLGNRVAAYDRKLETRPDPSDLNAVARYNAMVGERNDLVGRLNAANAGANSEVEAYNKLQQQTTDELNRAKAALDAVQQKFNARARAFEAFEKSEADVALWFDVNRLLTDVRAAMLAGQAPVTLHNQVRGIRRELAQWAISHAEATDNGHVIVEVRLGDEPAWLIVDTGAQQTTVSPELAEAVGLRVAQGEETTLRLAGGEKVRGRKITIPLIAVGTVKEHSVAAVAVKAGQVGIDGLLGQSFLKRFIYTIDETKTQKLWLVRRGAPRTAEGP